jgi:hypothetical protein
MMATVQFLIRGMQTVSCEIGGMPMTSCATVMPQPVQIWFR